MTTTTAAGPAALATDRGAAFRRTALAVIAPIGPVAVAVIRGVLPYDTTDDSATAVGKVAAHPAVQDLVLWLDLLGAVTLLVGVIVVSRVAVRGAPLLGSLGAVITFVSFAWLLAGPALTDPAALAGSRAGVDQADTSRILDAMAAHPSATAAVAVFVVGHILGLVLLGCALWRGRTVPLWTAALLIVSQPLHLVFAVVAPNHLLDALAWTLTAVGFAAAAITFVRSDDQARRTG